MTEESFLGAASALSCPPDDDSEHDYDLLLMLADAPQTPAVKTVSGSFADIWKSLEAEHTQEASGDTAGALGETALWSSEPPVRRVQRASPKGKRRVG